MRALIWNIRGFGRRGRRDQLRDFLRKARVDILFLQETIRQEFSLQELESLEIGDKFFWTWLPASGHSGGLLVGFRDSCFDVGVVHKGEFLISTKLVLKASRFFFEFVGVYGPTDHSRSPLFLQELEEVVSRATSPMLIAGDFNLIRGSTNKNNRNIDWSRVNLFNDSIAHLQLR
jgi:exonuclease III